MATGMFGANVEALMDIARDFDGRSEVPRSSGGNVERAIADVDWIGNDADAYRSSWGASLPQQLRDLADLTWDYSDQLERHAQEQEDASKAGDGGCLEATGDFFGGLWGGAVDFFRGFVVDGLWGDIKGILGLIGMNFDDGFSWTFGNFLENWGGLLSGLSGLIGLDTGTWSFSWDTFTSSWGGMLGEFFAVDMWGDDPWGALGKVVWNVGSLFIPGYNIAKVLKFLKHADVPTPHVDAPSTHRGGDADAPTNRGDADGQSNRGDSDTSTTPNASSTTPPAYRFDDDGNMLGRGDTDLAQRTDIQRGDASLNRDVTDRGSTFDRNTVYETTDGQRFVTNENGQVEYSSITRTGDDLSGSDRSGMGTSSRDYWDHDPGDQRGHHNPAFMGGTNDNVNLTQQSPGANAGSGRGLSSENPQTHQNIIEQRTQQYMQNNPTEPVTWERHTVYGPDGHATGYNVRVTDDAGTPIDVTNRGADPHLTPDGDGWVYIAD
ncbi:hypothetical protein GCM10011490_03030 [Pseudoclavibacter endophyticus]|uniref:WXG100 family type VII secretion target n=1 Tax=Pseudoclavibacter endophyticus TaxID=1778590 RepID=A0A6H9WTA1_9MICO|nr:hypothetical protein [Pseudoclavibacter endophyticus]KAB1650167.1 hypothetical protein F8O04_08195 [Pseudoclavibacter endophyticus]GGA56580.1 hypothetical protein GCM10011490_03030 [Pseudoclavibacter endophyticus]